MVTTPATVVLRVPALSFQWTGVAAMTATVQLAYRHRRCVTPLFVLTMATTAIRSLLWAKLADSLHGFAHAPRADLFELHLQLLLWLQQPWPWAFMVFLLISMTLVADCGVSSDDDDHLVQAPACLLPAPAAADDGPHRRSGTRVLRTGDDQTAGFERC